MQIKIGKTKKVLNYGKLLLWKYFKFTRPSWLQLSGKFSFDNNTFLSATGKSKLVVNGNVDFCGSTVILDSSNLFFINGVINNSTIVLTSSTINLKENTHIKDAVVSMNNSEINAGNHFRIHGYNFNLNESKVIGKDYLFFEKMLYHLPNLDINKSTFEAGNNCKIQAYVYCNEGNFMIKDNVFINYGSKISCIEKIEIGSNVLISYDCIILDNNSHSTDAKRRLNEMQDGFPNGTLQTIENRAISEPIIIGNNVWIGMRSIVLKGCNLGNGVVVGINTIVTNDVTENILVYGLPNAYKSIEK